MPPSDAAAPQRPGVMFVADSLVPRGGMENALIALVGELARDMDVSVIVLSGPELPPDALHPSVGCTYLGVAFGPARLAHSVVPLRRALRSVPPSTTTVAVGLWCTVVLSWSRRLELRNCVAWEHSLTERRIAISPKVRLLWLLARPGFRRADVTVCVSQLVEDTLASAPRGRGPRTVVIPNLVAPAPRAQSPRRAEDCAVPVRLLGLGALAPVKNWHLAVEAMQHLPSSWTLRIAGEGLERARLQARVAELSLDDRVQLLGHRDDVQDLLSESDVLVHPSLSETFGYSLFEAATHGVAVVVCDYPVMNGLVPRYIPGVTAGDEPLSFAAAVRAASALRANAQLWLECADRRADAFGPSTVMRRWHQVLRSAQGRAASPG